VPSHDDDLTEWQDSPLVAALNAPATPAELAGERTALAAFRAAVPVSTRRRHLGRLGVGGSALALAIALSGGVAAAYTATLPAPLQRVANELGGWAAVPAVHPAHPAKKVADKHTVTPTGQPTVPPTSTSSPPTTAVVVSPSTTSSTGPNGHHPAATGLAVHPGARPSTAPSKSAPPPSPTPTPTPSATPSPTLTASTPPPPVVPGSITITVGTTKVPVNSSVSVAGQLATSSGAPIANRRVWLIERSPGAGGASEVATGLTDSGGSVDLTSPPLTRTTRLRLVIGDGVRSAAVTVVVIPTMTATVTLQGSAYAVAVTTSGGEPGDVVTLQQRTPSGWVVAASGQLDTAATAAFTVPVPTTHAAHYRVLLPRTIAHGFAMTRFSVPVTSAVPGG
jgi:hypothetical protein